MADNVAVTAGAGTTIAADEVADGTLGTVKVQFVKLMDGTLDGTTKAAVGANGLAVSAVAAASTSGGSSRASAIVPNNVTNVIVKNSPGQLYGIRCFNNSATPAYLKLYDAVSATAGSGTPSDRLMIPANSTNGAGILTVDTLGEVYATGITYIVTTGIADNDTGAPAASTYLITILYK